MPHRDAVQENNEMSSCEDLKTMINGIVPDPDRVEGLLQKIIEEEEQCHNEKFVPLEHDLEELIDHEIEGCKSDARKLEDLTKEESDNFRPVVEGITDHAKDIAKSVVHEKLEDLKEEKSVAERDAKQVRDFTKEESDKIRPVVTGIADHAKDIAKEVVGEKLEDLKGDKLEEIGSVAQSDAEQVGDLIKKESDNVRPVVKGIAGDAKDIVQGVVGETLEGDDKPGAIRSVVGSDGKKLGDLAKEESDKIGPVVKGIAENRKMQVAGDVEDMKAEIKDAMASGACADLGKSVRDLIQMISGH